MLTPSHTLAAQAVPRYTSYPTAPHFTAAVNAEVYGDWLAALDPKASLSIYLHVPFCSELCHYCGCHTKLVKRREPIEAYAERLLSEITLVAARTGRRKVVHIHWGGGTPSMLGPERLAEVAARLREAFALADDCEHAIELDPRQVDRSIVRALLEMGVTRASLGVQDFSAHVQQAIGRVQPFGIVADVVTSLREAGIANINMDLMYGLPRQTERDIRRTILLADSLNPQRIALFGYAHVPWFKSHQRLISEDELPNAPARLAQAEIAQDTLKTLGYVSIGLDHFAKPEDSLAIAAASGRLHRNFQGYTTDQAEALIGLGASAIGQLPQGFAQNAPDIGGYSRAILAGRLATVKGFERSAQDRLRATLIERLMCDFQIDVDAITAKAGLGPLSDLEGTFSALSALAAEGVVQIDGHRVTVTEPGRPYVRLAAAAFDAYLPRGQARHSAAV